MPLIHIALIVGMVFGAIMIASVCFVYVKSSTLDVGGTALCLVGALLIGMSVWSTAQIEVSPGGLKLQVEQLQDKVEEVERNTQEISDGVDQVRTATRTLSTELADVAVTAQTGNRQIVQLSESLLRRQAIDPAEAEAIRERIETTPQLDPNQIRRSQQLDLHQPR